MSERPIILFPEPEFADRARLNPGFSRYNKPSVSRQYERLNPAFAALRRAFDQKSIAVQNSPIGINPELALVFEVFGSVENFYTAVKKVEGLEWMFDIAIDDIEADEDFYSLNEKNQREDKKLTGRVYCVMSNQGAMKQLLSLWERYKNNDTNIFGWGFTGLRDVFINIKVIRPWNAQDRIYETQVKEYWEESLQYDNGQPVHFEVELFFRKDLSKRQTAYNTIENAVTSLNGSIIKQCIIEGIAYHCALVSLPRASVQELVSNYEEILLAKVDDIMFFRPICQTAFVGSDDTIALTITPTAVAEPLDEPIIAVFDGMPMQNHSLLSGKLIIDDPDDFENGYESKYRQHGTAMSSLVLYGDIGRNEKALSRKIYVRPILKPEVDFNGNSVEFVPHNIILVDLIHRAVKRIFRGEGDIQPVAPTIKVINLSIGDPARVFTNAVSPLARLLDWLSYEYKVLFIVSAGNHNAKELPTTKTFAELQAQTIDERTAEIFNGIIQDIRNLKVLSPAESLNCLTVGALFSDASTANENTRQIFLTKDGLPSPISSFGFGYNKMIKPDLFYFGGRKLVYNDFSNNMKWSYKIGDAPGCQVAAPFSNGTVSGRAFTFGTSDATAQLTHEAGKCYDILSEIFNNETGGEVPADFAPLLLKAMLTHGTSWEGISGDIATCTNQSEKQISRWIGNGVPNISRVEECAKNRVTLIGMGMLKPEEAHIYKLPLPFDFSSQHIKRKLTATLAYFSPISPTKQKYRSIQMWFEIDHINLLPDRQNTEWQKVRKGTLQHEIFTGDNVVVWDVDKPLIIKVNCKDDAEKVKDKIQYGLFITFEVAQGIDLDIYSEVTAKIKQAVPITNIIV